MKILDIKRKAYSLNIFHGVYITSLMNNIYKPKTTCQGSHPAVLSEGCCVKRHQIWKSVTSVPKYTSTCSDGRKKLVEIERNSFMCHSWQAEQTYTFV